MNERPLWQQRAERLLLSCRPPESQLATLTRRLQDALRPRDGRGLPRPSRPPPTRWPPRFPASSRTEEVGKGGHRACVLGSVTRVGKPSASAILAASVGLFSYHVNRRRRPVGGGEAAAALSEKGKKTTRGRGCRGWATR